MFNTLKLVNTHFGDILIHLDCPYLGTFVWRGSNHHFKTHIGIRIFSVLLFGFSSWWFIRRLVSCGSASLSYLSNLLIVREPLERLDVDHKGLDVWELILYVLSLSFIVEGMCSKRTSVSV